MTANTSPIFTLTPRVEWSTISTANTAYDGTGTVASNTIGATFGTYVKKLILKPLGTNVTTKLMIFINNGSANSTAANNTMVYDITLPASTASNSSMLPTMEIPLDLILPSGYKLLFTLGTAVSAGWQITTFSGDY